MDLFSGKTAGTDLQSVISISKKLLVVFVAVVALLLIVGLGTALAAQRHDDAPARFAVTTMPLVAYATPTTTITQHLIGTIQSVNQAKKTFTLLVTGQTKAITIAFDTKTKLHDWQQTFKLTAKAHVLVDVSKRSNGTFYAVGVEPIPTGYDHGARHMGPHGTCTPGTRLGMRH